MSRRQNRYTDAGSDADPDDPRNSESDSTTTDSAGEEDTSQDDSADEYDINSYLAEEMRAENIQLAAFLAQLRGVRFVECGVFMRSPECKFLKRCRKRPAPEGRGKSSRHSKRSCDGPQLQWSVPMPINLGRKRIVGPERETTTLQEVQENPGPTILEAEEFEHEDTTDDVDANSVPFQPAVSDVENKSGSSYLVQERPERFMDLVERNSSIELWDEELWHDESQQSTTEPSTPFRKQETPPQSVWGLRWEEVPSEETPEQMHRTLRSGAADDFDSVFNFDL